MKQFEQMTAAEKERMRIVLQGIRDQMVAFNKSIDRLVNVVGEFSTDNSEMIEYFEEAIPEDRPLTLEDVQEFIDEFVQED